MVCTDPLGNFLTVLLIDPSFDLNSEIIGTSELLLVPLAIGFRKMYFRKNIFLCSYSSICIRLWATFLSSGNFLNYIQKNGTDVKEKLKHTFKIIKFVLFHN